MHHNAVDLAIIGGGPVGLFAAYYSGLREISCSIIESLPALGGRLVSVFPEKYIYDVPGFPKVRARDLANNLIEQAHQSSPSVFLNETVAGIKKRGNEFVLETTRGEHLSRAVLIVGGIGVSVPQKHSAPGATDFEGKGIEYIVTNVNNYRDKNVIIAGGGDSAIDWAQELLSVAASVTLVHRSARFRAHEKNVAQLKASGVRIITDAEIVSFEGGTHLRKVVVRQKGNNAEDTALNADNALIMFGFRSDISAMNDWGLHLTPDKDQVIVDQTMRTNIAGIYAAGDIAAHTAKITLLATGFGEAAIAVNYIKTHLDPTQETQPIYSTSVMENKRE